MGQRIDVDGLSLDPDAFVAGVCPNYDELGAAMVGHCETCDRYIEAQKFAAVLEMLVDDNAEHEESRS